MQRSKQELEAAVLDLMRERAWQINKNPKYRELWSVELVEAIELAVTVLRETVAGMDGFEAFVESGAGDVSISWAGGEDDAENTLTDALKKYYLAGRASASADVDALADEVTRLQNWCRNSEQVMAMFDTPQRVRDILAARRKEGK